MKKANLLNPELVRAIAKLGHTEFLVIADAGLPIPAGVPVIDLSLIQGVPSFLDVLTAVCSELIVESYIYASELPEQNAEVFEPMKDVFAKLEEGEITGQDVSHTEFKELMKQSRVVVRTGECSPYANVILVGGVNF